MTWETNWLRYLAQQSASSESTTIAPSSPDAEPGIRPEGEGGPQLALAAASVALYRYFRP